MHDHAAAMTKAFERIQEAQALVEGVPSIDARKRALRALEVAERALLDLDLDLEECPSLPSRGLTPHPEA